ncbi:alpha/beta fold hydrolase [Psychromonas sp. MME1]|uniref:alpha/beta fold hydrolase n=1 Tax=Psychromonas sp. MME1 TaxID=3231032 RepID=UPI0034E21C47
MLYESRLEKASRSFRISGLLISALEKFTRTSISVEGLENTRANPTLFVVNHFTRIETCLLPKVLYQFNGQMVHSLADSALFVGKFGQFLTSVGAFPVNLKGRDEKIISELMRGSYNWVIFPEGSMMKNKKVVENGRLQLHLPHIKRSPYTGAATLALKSFLLKEDYKQAIADNNEKLINFYQDTYHLRGPGNLDPLDLCIVPVNITYYPLRPGRNLLATGVQLLLKDLPPKVEEELLVEGKLLLQESDMSISFGHPLDVRSFCKPYRRLFNLFLPFLSTQRKINWLMLLMRHRLTRLFMHRIYKRLSINMDHLVATALRYVPVQGIAEQTFKQVIYLAIVMIKNHGQRRVHQSIDDRVINLIAEDPYKPYESIIALAESEKVLRREDGLLYVDHNKIKLQHAFHRVRLDNTTAVLANEFEVMEESVAAIKKLLANSAAKLTYQVADAIMNRDCSIYEEERMRSYIKDESKSRDVGKPRHLVGDKSKPGIVLIHGFLASPLEMLALGEYLNKLGYGVYLVRLEGHGTHPSELENATVEKWRDSVQRGYALLSHYYRKVIVVGFSAGALLALLKGSSEGKQLAGIVAINPALTLRQKSSQLSPMLDRWNKALHNLSLKRGTLPWLENESENSDSNYDKIYISGLRQFTELQALCGDKLAKVRAPLLIIQGSNDPLVDPSGAREIVNTVCSSQKKLEEIAFNRHVIVRGTLV